MDNKTLYLNVTRSSVSDTEKVKLKDVASIFCLDLDVTHDVENIIIFQFNKNMEGRQVISVLKVIELIHQEHPEINVVNIGDPEFIIYHKPPKKRTKKAKRMEYVKVAFVCIIAFVGAAFTIMTYNNDVGVNDVFNNIYELFMGKQSGDNNILQVGYAIGLTTGMLFFFNHIARHRLTDEPTPLEVEMRLYERDVNDATAISSNRNETTVDVK